MTAHIARRAAGLEISRGGVPDRRYPLGDGTVRIGRAHDNDLVLEDSTKAVSRYHAEIRHEDEAYVLVDLASQNGTWVAAERVERVTLEPGREVTIGPYRLSLLDDTSDLAQPQTAIEGARSSGASAEAQPGPTPTTDPQRGSVARPATGRHTSARPRLPARVLWAAAGGAVVIAALLATVVLLGGRPVTWPPAPHCRCTPRETLDQRIADALRLASGDDLDKARDALMAIREWRPEDPSLTALLAEVDARRFAAVDTGETPPSPPTPVPGPTTDPETGLTRGKNEKVAAFQKRVREANESYEAVMAAVGRDDSRAATAALATLQQLAPKHTKLSAARLSVQQVIDAFDRRVAGMLQEARTLEASGNLAPARRKLLDANTLKPGSADEDLERVTNRMAQLGEDDYKKGKAAETLGNRARAKAFYQHALDLLPPDHKDRAACEARLKALQ